MNSQEFKEILNERLKKIKSTIKSKGQEYATEDRLYNFKRAAKILETSPEEALAGMFVKHLVSVLDLIEGTLTPTKHLINEKIGDTINYLILLEAMLLEKFTDEEPF